MADIALTAAQVEPIYPTLCEIYSVKLAAAVTKGAAGYQLTTGLFGVADANDAGKQQFRGIYLKAGAAGQTVSLLKRGFLYGYTLTSQDWDDPLYLSDTAGVIADSVGTMTVVVGRVVALPDLTKAVYIDAQWGVVWS